MVARACAAMCDGWMLVWTGCCAPEMGRPVVATRPLPCRWMLMVTRGLWMLKATQYRSECEANTDALHACNLWPAMSHRKDAFASPLQ